MPALAPDAGCGGCAVRGWPRHNASASVRQLVEEHGGGLQIDVAIAFLAKAMPFVLRGEIPDFAALGADTPDHLLRLGRGHTRIVETRHDEQRPADRGRIVK